MQPFVSPNNHLSGREKVVVTIISSSDKKHLRRFWTFDDLLNRALYLDQFSSNFVNITGGSFESLNNYFDFDHQLILTC